MVNANANAGMWEAIGLEEPLACPQSGETNICEDFPATKRRKWVHGGLTFRADFDSSNLGDVIPRSAEGEFDLWIRPDCAGRACETKHRTWFYFGLSGQAAGQVLTFNVVNMNKQSKLFSFDMKPVYLTPGVSKQWEPVPEAVRTQMVDSGFKVSFSHRFSSERETFFAFCIPFSCADNERLMDRVERHAQASGANSRISQVCLGVRCMGAS